MGNWLRILSVFALLLSVVVAGQVKAQEDNTDDDLPPQGNIVVVDSAFVRGGPSDEFIAVGALFEGDEVTPLNISEDGLWILIPYSRGNGWIQRNLVRWEDNDALDLLPVLPANITPTPRIAVTNTPFIPTNTPVGNYINLEGAASAYVRAGPGRTYLRLGQLLPGDSVEPVGRNDDTTWIMIRFLNEPLNDGFGWIAVELVYWEDYNSLQSLPVLDSGNLTPTITFTPSATASSTNTPTHTATITETSVSTLTASATNSDFPTSTNTAIPTSEPTDTATSTDLPTNTATATDEPTNTATATLVPTSTDTTTPTNTATATTEPTQTNTATSVPTNTPTITATSTDLPTNTATWTVEPSATNTDVPTATATATVTETPTDEPTNTATATLVPTSTDTEQATEIIEAVVVASDTVTPTSTSSSTPTPTITNTPTVEMTDIFAVQGTSVAIEATNQALGVSPEPTQTIDSVQESPTQDNSRSISVEGVVAVALLFVVVTYSWFYLQGLAASGRYADGFVIHKCPVCGRGNLHLDTKQSRIVGIPIVRRIVRCDECRSVLRETGSQRWRYAVDRIENPSLYARFNGHEISDSDLERLAKSSSQLASTDANTQLMVDDLES